MCIFAETGCSKSVGTAKDWLYFHVSMMCDRAVGSAVHSISETIPG